MNVLLKEKFDSSEEDEDYVPDQSNIPYLITLFFNFNRRITRTNNRVKFF